MTPEGKVKKMIRLELDKYGKRVHYFMPVQAGFGATSLDFLCCNAGRFFAIEAKAPGKTTRPLQEQVARTIRASGGQVFIIDGPDNPDFQRLKDWLV